MILNLILVFFIVYELFKIMNVDLFIRISNINKEISDLDKGNVMSVESQKSFSNLVRAAIFLTVIDIFYVLFLLYMIVAHNSGIAITILALSILKSVIYMRLKSKFETNFLHTVTSVDSLITMTLLSSIIVSK